MRALDLEALATVAMSPLRHPFQQPFARIAQSDCHKSDEKQSDRCDKRLNLPGFNLVETNSAYKSHSSFLHILHTALEMLAIHSEEGRL